NKVNRFKMDSGRESKIANIKKLHNLLENSTDVREILSDFLDYYPHQLQLIKEKATKNAFIEMANQVHKLKGSLSNFDAEKATEILKNLEEYVKEENKKAIEEYLVKLENELEILKSYLLKHLN
ncbi:MAG: Hpt domain-containing protein, partial [Bacteroidota bacterium]